MEWISIESASPNEEKAYLVCRCIETENAINTFFDIAMFLKKFKPVYGFEFVTYGDEVYENVFVSNHEIYGRSILPITHWCELAKPKD